MNSPRASGVERIESPCWRLSEVMCVESSSVDRIPYACSKNDFQNWHQHKSIAKSDTHMTGLSDWLCADRKAFELWKDLGGDDLMELCKVGVDFL